MDGKAVALTLAALLLASFQSAWAQTPPTVTVNRQRHFAKTIPPGNYSGIAWLGDDRYAVVSDKSAEDGFFLFQISIDSITGEILDASNLGFHTAQQPGRDDEGICYVSQRNSLFISGEADNAIREYTLEGLRTGYTVPLPACYDHLPANLGLEALSYNPTTRSLWTCNESGEVNVHRWTLTEPERSSDSAEQGTSGDSTAFRSAGTWRYALDAPRHDRQKAWLYAHGIGTVCALDDGSLLVLEREAYVPKKKVGASVNCKLFRIIPDAANTIANKQLLTEWKTSLTLTSRTFANYEGMCLGPRLKDGSRVLILVADSQNQYRGVLRDWFKTLVIHLF